MDIPRALGVPLRLNIERLAAADRQPCPLAGNRLHERAQYLLEGEGQVEGKTRLQVRQKRLG
jgi:hypothetical protein